MILQFINNTVLATGEVPCANGTVQLVGGPNEFEGRVEFCANGSWAQVCDSGAWGPIPASLVCSAINSNRCELKQFNGVP